jgi:hypothetical protein
MSRKKPPIKPTPYWAEQAERLLKPKPEGNLVTPLGAPLPPNAFEEIYKQLPPLKDVLPAGLIQNPTDLSGWPKGIDPIDNKTAEVFVAQIALLAAEAAAGMEIPEVWYEPPEEPSAKA